MADPNDPPAFIDLSRRKSGSAAAVNAERQQEQTDASVQSLQANAARTRGTTASDIAKGKADVRTANQAAPINVLTEIANIRKDYHANLDVRAFTEIAKAYNSAVKTPNNGAGDGNLLTIAAKAQDPIGSVHETDPARIAGTAQTAIEAKLAGFQNEFDRNGFLSPQSRRDVRLIVRDRYLSAKPLADQAVEEANASLQFLNEHVVVPGGGKPIESASVIGKPIDQLYTANIGPFERQIVADEKRKAATPGTPEAAAAMEDPDRPHVGLLDQPPEGMHVAGEPIRAPRYDQSHVEAINAVTADPKSTPEDAAKAAADAQVDQGFVPADQWQKIYDQNLPAMREWYKTLTPEQRAGARGVSYQEADKRATIDAPIGAKIRQGIENVPESAANIIGPLATTPYDIEESIRTGNPQGVVNAVAHPRDTLDALSKKYTNSDDFMYNLVTDPLAVPSDVAGVLSGGGAGLRVAGWMGRGSRLGDIAGAAGRGAQHVAGYVDPLTAGGRLLNYTANPGGPISRATGRLGSYLVGGMTGTGEVPINIAAGAGWQAGRHGDTAALDAFNANRIDPGGNAPGTIAMAQEALNNFDRTEKQAYSAASDPFFNATDTHTLDLTGVRQQLDNAMPERYHQLEHLPDAERPGSHREWQRASEALDRQIALGVVDPTNLNPRNLDAFKKDWRETIDFDPADPSYRGAISGIMPNDVRDRISYRYPTEYPPIMERYGNFLNNKRAFRDTFGLGDTPNAPFNLESTGRKLGSSLRSNVNTNYGQRTTMLQQLAQHGAPTLPASLAGQAMSSLKPRGIQGALFGSGTTLAGAGLLSGFSPLSLLTVPAAMALSSPRVVGRGVSSAARALGAGSRAASRLADDLAPLGERYNAYRPIGDVLKVLHHTGNKVDDEDELRRKYLGEAPYLTTGGG